MVTSVGNIGAAIPVCKEGTDDGQNIEIELKCKNGYLKRLKSFGRVAKDYKVVCKDFNDDDDKDNKSRRNWKKEQKEIVKDFEYSPKSCNMRAWKNRGPAKTYLKRYFNKKCKDSSFCVLKLPLRLTA